jgi:hypothetical protein
MVAIRNDNNAQDNCEDGDRSDDGFGFHHFLQGTQGATKVSMPRALSILVMDGRPFMISTGM